MTPRHIACILILGALITAEALGAAALPAPLRAVKPDLMPVGAATLHWFGLHVYDVALYAQDATYKTNGTAALSIRYNISIKRRRLLDTTLKEWERMGKGGDIQRARWINQVGPLWPDLKSGDSLTAFRRQDGPTQFYFGDRLLGEVSDPAFGPAFFAIWLDEDCRYPEVRDGLLPVRKNAKKGR
jgi:hypothetical protein